MTSIVVSQVVTRLTLLRRLRTYSVKCALPKSATVTPIKTGEIQVATAAAVPPANPSRERTAAAVQFGTMAASPNTAPKALLTLFLVFTSWNLSF